jgi:hypothetical protein
MNNYLKIPVRSSAIVTNSYVASSNILGVFRSADIQDKNQLLLYVNFTKGSLTSAEVKVDFADNLKYSFAYDGQSANFTVGERISTKDGQNYATIVSDTDGGATGTLVVNNLVGSFADNAEIVGNLGGKALVNGATTDVSDWYQETASSVSGGTITESLAEHAFTSTGKYRIAIPLKDRYARISAKGTGTVDNSLVAIDAIVGQV